MDGEVLRLYLEISTGKACKVFQFKCVCKRSFYNASSSFHDTDTSVIRKHRTVDNLRSVVYRKKKKKKDNLVITLETNKHRQKSRSYDRDKSVWMCG